MFVHPTKLLFTDLSQSVDRFGRPSNCCKWEHTLFHHVNWWFSLKHRTSTPLTILFSVNKQDPPNLRGLRPLTLGTWKSNDETHIYVGVGGGILRLLEG